MVIKEWRNGFQVILKEREEKKGRLTVEHSVLGAEEPTEARLDLANDLPEETVSQEGEDACLCLK